MGGWREGEEGMSEGKRENETKRQFIQIFVPISRKRN